MAHNKVENPRVVDNRDVVQGISTASHVDGERPVFIRRRNIGTHVGHIIEHKAVFIVDREGPESTVTGIFEGARDSNLQPENLRKSRRDYLQVGRHPTPMRRLPYIYQSYKALAKRQWAQ